jgi:predicted HTH transcriptional regulator
MTTKELAEAIDALPAMEPAARARAAKELMEVARGVLAAERAAAMLEATTGPGAVSRSELARRLGISRQQVTKAISDHG